MQNNNFIYFFFNCGPHKFGAPITMFRPYALRLGHVFTDRAEKNIRKFLFYSLSVLIQTEKSGYP